MSSEELALAIVCTAIVFDDDEAETKPKRRRVWKRKWVERREEEGFCVKLYKELKEEEQSLFKNFLRMDVQQFNNLLLLVSPIIAKQDTVMRKSIPAKDRLILTLRFLSSGDSFSSLQYLFRIPKPTISTIIPHVLDAIYTVLVETYIKMPSTTEEWKAVANAFSERWQFPNCIGAVDGKHVVMVAPPNSGSIYYNYKGTHSIVLMGVADAEYKFIYIDVGRNGRFSDGGVFNRCSFAKAMDSNKLNLPEPIVLPGRDLRVPCLLVGDDAFAMRPNLMKPYSQRGLTMVQRVYNYRLSRARRVIENAFGILSARFRVLRSPIHLSPGKTKKVVLACCVLHNFMIDTNKRLYTPVGFIDQNDKNGNLIEGTWQHECSSTSTFLPLETPTNVNVQLITGAKEIQKELTMYFVEEGELSWQYQQI